MYCIVGNFFADGQSLLLYLYYDATNHADILQEVFSPSARAITPQALYMQLGYIFIITIIIHRI